MLLLLAALTLGAAPPVLLKDLEPGAALDAERYLDVDTGADPNLLVIQTTFWGTELFTVLDGRRSLVVDLCPGRCSGNPRQLTRLGGRVLFLGDRGGGFGLQLYATDGTAEGTVMLADVVASLPRLVPLDNQMVFNRAGKLWVTDGTPQGTGPLTWGRDHVVLSVQATAQHRFLATRPATGGCALFVTGLDVRQAVALPMPASTATEACGTIATLGERAFLSFSSGVWRFDATPSPAVLIEAAGRGPVRAGPALFFFGYGTPNQLTLFHSTGEPNGTTPLGSVPSEGLRQTTSVGPRLIYSVVDMLGAAHLHASDGTPGGTVELTAASEVLSLLTVGPVAYASVRNGTARELIETDGTKSGTVVLPGIHPDAPAEDHAPATAHALALAFIGTVVIETGAFRLRPGEDPETVFLQPGNPRDSASGPPVVVGAQAFFSADRVYRTDGTAEGTVPIADGGLVGRVRDRLLVVEGGRLGSVSIDGGDVTVLSAARFDAPMSANFGATAVVTAGSDPARLFVTDGAPAGTREVMALGKGLPQPPVTLDDGRAAFLVSDQVWFTDGTAAGTTAVQVPKAERVLAATDFAWVQGHFEVWAARPGAAVRVHSSPRATLLTALTPVKDRVYFIVWEDQTPRLWTADATGSTQLAQLNAFTALAAHQDRLMVLGDRGHGRELLEWDGAALVARAPAPGATFLKSAGGWLYADVGSPLEGQELHYFHEAFGLFLQAADLSPGPGSSSPSPPVALGPRVLFTAWTPDTGREPFAWTPDPLPPEPTARGCGCGAADGVWLLAALLLLRSPRRVLE